MAVHYSTNTCIAYPDDMETLNRIYHRLCCERGFCAGSSAAEDLARAAMNLFGQGVVDEDEIIETLNLYLDRKASGPNFSEAFAA